MRGGTQSAPGVRYFRRCMYVCDLKRGAEKQQQSTAKNQRELPGASHEILGWVTLHIFNYNLAGTVEAGTAAACGQNRFHKETKPAP
jgi:hypothetical protein